MLQDLRGLGSRAPAVVALDDDRSVLGCQPVERFGDDPLVQHGVHLIGLAAAPAGSSTVDLAPGAGAAPLVHHDTAGDREQPRARGPLLLVEHGRLAPGAQHRLLHDVLRASPVATGQAQDERPQRRGVLVVQRAQQLLVPVRSGHHHGW